MKEILNSSPVKIYTNLVIFRCILAVLCFFLRHSERFPTSVMHRERDLIISTLYLLSAVIQTASHCLIASLSKLSGFNPPGFFSYHCYSNFIEDAFLLLLFNCAGWFMLFLKSFFGRNRGVALHFQYGSI